MQKTIRLCFLKAKKLKKALHDLFQWQLFCKGIIFFLLGLLVSGILGQLSTTQHKSQPILRSFELLLTGFAELLTVVISLCMS